MLGTIAAAIVAFLLGVWITALYGKHVTDRNRKIEWEQNEKSRELSKPELDWTIIHIRDDLSFICSSLALVVGLLSALVVIMLTK